MDHDATTGTGGRTVATGAVLGYDRPWLFYGLATAIPWVLWSVAGYLSHLPVQSNPVRLATAAAELAGLAAPAIVAAALVYGNPRLRADIRGRLLWGRGVRKRYIACAFLLLLASILVAQAISVLLGYSVEQFRLRHGFSFSSGLVPVWVVLLVAPVLEELAWHGYGTDALVNRMRLFTASMLFMVIWTVWHVPLSFIKGYYQSEVVESGWVNTLNFPLSMIGFVLLMNWLYYRAGRSIGVAIVFHISAGFVNEIFMTDPHSKLIQTGLLLALSAVVVVRNRELFFARPQRRCAPEPHAVAQWAHEKPCVKLPGFVGRGIVGALGGVRAGR